MRVVLDGALATAPVLVEHDGALKELAPAVARPRSVVHLLGEAAFRPMLSSISVASSRRPALCQGR